MSRAKRKKPHDPARAHDRRSRDLPRNAEVATVEVDNPLALEPGEKIVALRSIRNDPLGCLHSRRQIDEARLDRVERLRTWAEAHGRTLLEVAIGGLAAVSPVASVIAGATKPEQVRANAAASDWEPTPDELAELLDRV